MAYSEVLLGSQNLTKQLTSTNAKSVAQKFHLLDVVVGSEFGDMRLDVFGRVEFEGQTLEGKDLAGRGHGNEEKAAKG